MAKESNQTVFGGEIDSLSEKDFWGNYKQCSIARRIMEFRRVCKRNAREKGGGKWIGMRSKYW
jgi:hypothetical protein